ncbi:hypothetical protein HYP71_gp045 [Arthrobacter phage KBurrousTX]|uniref:Uncharacterized protein n=1 Tax=Arthrobacter phage KBurrousTX TaxID=2315608 RepID=A0A386K8F6_9CAUD|nr:hypothetical protein HYP71_gp045 [Arthrobacter phage KBurrousTX]AYD81539.1 hypothetical protein KBurrousTX_45 [Arthrobacter phage KBurrousTX]
MSAPCTTVKPFHQSPQTTKEVIHLDTDKTLYLNLFEVCHNIPSVTRETGAEIVLEALRVTYEDLPADAPIDQTARVVALCLRGEVAANELFAAFELWMLRHQIADPQGDLEWLLDLPNTEANREREVVNAEGNLMAAVNAILDKAGVK